MSCDAWRVRLSGVSLFPSAAGDPTYGVRPVPDAVSVIVPKLPRRPWFDLNGPARPAPERRCFRSDGLKCTLRWPDPVRGTVGGTGRLDGGLGRGAASAADRGAGGDLDARGGGLALAMRSGVVGLAFADPQGGLPSGWAAVAGVRSRARPGGTVQSGGLGRGTDEGGTEGRRDGGRRGCRRGILPRPQGPRRLLRSRFAARFGLGGGAGASFCAERARIGRLHQSRAGGGELALGFTCGSPYARLRK